MCVMHCLGVLGGPISFGHREPALAAWICHGTYWGYSKGTPGVLQGYSKVSGRTRIVEYYCMRIVCGVHEV